MPPRATVTNTARKLTRPVPLTVGMLFIGFMVFVLVMICLMTLLGPGGTYTINDEEVSRGTFIARALPPIAGIAAMLGVVYWGLLKHRTWVRPLLVAYAAILEGIVIYLSLGSPQPVLILVWSTLSLAVPAAVGYWILYREPEVVAYYDQLRANCPHGSPHRETRA